MNAAKLNQIKLNDWASHAKNVNALISAAQQIDNLGPSKVGFSLDLKFEPVVEHIAVVTVQSASVPVKGSFAGAALPSSTPAENPDPPAPRSSEKPDS
ncbi:MAG: hypothetical protein L3J92_05080 [Thermoplasmata archaeon]|nr:hypothetical protein [Thermoplasmata archaeon]